MHYESKKKGYIQHVAYSINGSKDILIFWIERLRTHAHAVRHDVIDDEE